MSVLLPNFNDNQPSTSSLPPHTRSHTPSHSRAPSTSGGDENNGPCFILPHQLDASVASFLEPVDGEPITTSSPCRCGQWYFPSLPPSLGGCGHIYRVQPYVCTWHPFPTPCPGVDFTRRVRSQYYVLGLCPACKHIPDKMADYNARIDKLSNPESVEQGLLALLAMQEYFREQKHFFRERAKLQKQSIIASPLSPNFSQY